MLNNLPVTLPNHILTINVLSPTYAEALHHAGYSANCGQCTFAPPPDLLKDFSKMKHRFIFMPKPPIGYHSNNFIMQSVLSA